MRTTEQIEARIAELEARRDHAYKLAIVSVNVVFWFVVVGLVLIARVRP